MPSLAFMFVLVNLALDLQLAESGCSPDRVTFVADQAKEKFTDYYDLKEVQSASECASYCFDNLFCEQAGLVKGSTGKLQCLLSLKKSTCVGAQREKNPKIADQTILKCITCADTTEAIKSQPKKPNILVIMVDDMGYGDLGVYGNTQQEWGPIDDLAYAGLRFTQGYSGDSLCSPSRSSFMTGRLAARNGATSPIVGGERVWQPFTKEGLPKANPTIPKILKTAGYRTGMTGKWHLGINARNKTDGEFLPSRQGFDEVGTLLPFTSVWECDQTGVFFKEKPDVNRCFVYEGDKIMQQPIIWDTLTDKLLNSFDKFIKKDSSTPWFYYFAFPHVHTPLNVAPRFKGTSKRGMFGENLNELQWAVGEIVSKLRREGLDRNTLIVYMSDHGPHTELCTAGGNAAGMKGIFYSVSQDNLEKQLKAASAELPSKYILGGKSNSWEGGFRIPFFSWWPGVIPRGGQSEAVISAIDLLPTFASLAGATIDKSIVLDGEDMTDYLLGRKSYKDQKTKPHTIFMYCVRKLFAVRHGPYKIHYHIQRLAYDNETKMVCPDGLPLRDMYTAMHCDALQFLAPMEPLVFNLEHDPFENYAINITRPEIVKLLSDVKILVDEKEKSLKDHSLKPILAELDRSIVPCCNPPKCQCDLYTT